MMSMFVMVAAALMLGFVSGLLGVATQSGNHRPWQQIRHCQERRRNNLPPPLYGEAANAAPIVGVEDKVDNFVDDDLDLQNKLNAVGLGLCHGILHASGVRRFSDIAALTARHITEMGADSFDRRILLGLIDEKKGDQDSATTTTSSTHIKLSTNVSGAFDREPVGRFEETIQQDFGIRAICNENCIFVGRLFTPEQCRQINRMAEYHAYRQIGVIGEGWTNELYTLTAQHMQCKDVPGMLSTTNHIFQDLTRELYTLFPGRIRPGSIVPESDGEPHLVKYHGKAKGTAMHTDNSEYIYITVNVMLSDDNDFTGGGTYIEAIDRTVQLKQGEMLIHLGDLEHAGRDIVSGVRRLLISFYACEWEQDDLNVAKPGQARDFVALSPE